MTEKKCPECGGNLIKESNELRCEDCGLILEEDFLDRRPEWSAFTSSGEEKKGRTGPPSTVTRHDKGLKTEIGFRDRYGRELGPKKKKLFSRLRKWHSQMQTSSGKEKSLSEGLQELQRIAGQLNLPRSIREIASVIYKRASSENLIKGRSIEAIASSALYIAARFYEVPRTLDEFVEVSRVGRTEIARAERYLVNELDIPLKPVTPESFIPKLKSDLGFGDCVEEKSFEVIDLAKKRQVISGKDPISISSAAIYIASRLCNEKITQRKISEASDVSEVTIRNRYKELLDKLEITF